MSFGELQVHHTIDWECCALRYLFDCNGVVLLYVRRDWEPCLYTVWKSEMEIITALEYSVFLSIATKAYQLWNSVKDARQIQSF